MKLCLIVASFVWLATSSAQTIPEQIWGKWVVTRQLPTRTISCWGQAEAKALLGTEMEYSRDAFRWKDVITTHPVAEAKVVGAEQFTTEHSGQGSASSQVTFRQLGIDKSEALQISIHHDPAQVTGGTEEIPGDEVLVKDTDTIVFAVCNLYFEAKRAGRKGASPDPATAKKGSVDGWLGKWIGPEGTYLLLSKRRDNYIVKIRSLDGLRTYVGNANGKTIEFIRGGKAESIHAGKGPDTGMKWLADKKNCLIIKEGAGFCRD